MSYWIILWITIAVVITRQLIGYIIYKCAKVKLFKSFYPTKEIPFATNLSKEEILNNLKLLYLHGKIRYLCVTEQYVSFEDKSLFLSGNVYYLRFSDPSAISYRGKTRVYNVDKQKLEEMSGFFSQTV